MSQEEINLLCTNRGLISPMRVCVCVRVSVRVCVCVGGVAPVNDVQVNAGAVRVRVSAGGVS